MATVREVLNHTDIMATFGDNSIAKYYRAAQKLLHLLQRHFDNFSFEREMLTESIVREFSVPISMLSQFWTALTREYPDRPFKRDDVKSFRLSGRWRLMNVTEEQDVALKTLFAVKTGEIFLCPPSGLMQKLNFGLNERKSLNNAVLDCLRNIGIEWNKEADWLSTAVLHVYATPADPQDLEQAQQQEITNEEEEDEQSGSKRKAKQQRKDDSDDDFQSDQ